MKTILRSLVCVITCYLFNPLNASSQIVYSGGTYSQNFNSLSQNTSEGGILDVSDPWNDNSTLPGWYSNRSTYTTNPGILGLSIGVGVTNNLTSVGSGSDRALGSYLGALSLGAPVTHGLRIQNSLGTPMTQFTLSFDLESSVSGLGGIVALNVLDAYALSYSTTASDVSGVGATGFGLVKGNANLLNLNLLGSGSDTRRLEITIGNLNIAQGADLWLRWDRASLLGVVDNSLAIDNLSFNAVPEPGTYLLFGLSLMILMLPAVWKKFSHSSPKAAQTVVSGIHLGSILMMVFFTPGLNAQEEPEAQLMMEPTIVRSSKASPSESTTEAAKPSGASSRTYEYAPEWNRMMLVKDFESTYSREISEGKITVVEPSNYFKSVRNYHVASDNTSIPSPVVWLHHESYLLGRKTAGDNNREQNGVAPEIPVARPNKLMPVMDAVALFGTAPLSKDEYFDKMYLLRGELMESTRTVTELLKLWDNGSVSSQDLSVLQSASRVEWVVCCRLVPESKEIEDLLNSLYQTSNVRLNPNAMTPSTTSAAGYN
jgi:hypothetical protein